MQSNREYRVEDIKMIDQTNNVMNETNLELIQEKKENRI